MNARLDVRPATACADVRFGVPGEDVAAAWAQLASRAAPNVFACPAALQAVEVTGFSRLCVLQAWLRDAQPARLIGLWALRRSRISPLGPSVLAAPAYDQAFVSNPVLDPEHMHLAMSALLDAIQDHGGLPDLVHLRYLDAGGPSCAALLAALAARGAAVVQVSDKQRPFATPHAAGKPAGATRKKIRQKWKRLQAAGCIEVRNERSPAAVRAAFEAFLGLEAGSWKGRRGTALLSEAGTAAFCRRWIGALADADQASVALLLLDGRPVAAQVLLYAGRMAYTWKTAFDAGAADVSPGALLLDTVTARLFASGGIDAIESCSTEDSFMNQLWQGRRTTVHLVADLGPRPSLAFRALALGACGYGQWRALRAWMRAAPGAAVHQHRSAR